jgi:DNA-binding NarL/FixJ family response regulator
MDERGTRTVIIAEPYLPARRGLRQLLAALPMELRLLEAGDEQALQRQLQQSPVSLVIVDYAPAGVFSYERLRQLREQHPATAVLLIGPADDAEHLQRGLAWGVEGFLTRSCDEEEIGDAVRSLLKGEKFYCTRIVDFLLEKTFSAGSRPAVEEVVCPAGLSRREIDIIRLTVAGYQAKEVAAMLHLSVHTVYTHRKNIRKKLQINTTAGLSAFAIDNGLVENNKQKI